MGKKLQPFCTRVILIMKMNPYLITTKCKPLSFEYHVWCPLPNGSIVPLKINMHKATKQNPKLPPMSLSQNQAFEIIKI